MPKYWVNYKFPNQKDEFMQTKVVANDPDEALTLVLDRLSAEAADYEIKNHPSPPITIEEVENIRFLYCGLNRFAQG